MNDRLSGEQIIDNIIKLEELNEGNRKLKALLPALMERQAMTARLIRVTYLSLIHEGFTAEEALELCKKI